MAEPHSHTRPTKLVEQMFPVSEDIGELSLVYRQLHRLKNGPVVINTSPLAH